MNTKRYKILACEVFFRELCSLMVNHTKTFDLEFLPKGLHDLGCDRMKERLQERLDAVPAGRYEAILLLYGLCNNGLCGISSSHTRIVIPRSHDCIAVFMGGRGKYEEYFNSHPGTYYRTSGWMERESAEGAGEATIMDKLGMTMKYAELVEKYGEDNAKYVMETMCIGAEHYDRIAYINMGLECDSVYRDMAKKEAADKGWNFDELTGSLRIMKGLIDGDWGEDFLVIEPGSTIAPSYDKGVVCSKKTE
jgi:Protein of unknown function (DUF1638)